jgi:flagellin-like hook-associated protein FlgL
MAVEVSSCVREIVCSLSQPAIGLLNGILSTQITLLQSQVVAISAQLLTFDVLQAPVVVANAAAQTALQQVKEIVNIVPLNLIGQCADLGNVNLGLNRSIDGISAELEAITQDATRLLSFREELVSLQNELNATIDLFQAVQQVIATCGV